MEIVVLVSIAVLTSITLLVAVLVHHQRLIQKLRRQLHAVEDEAFHATTDVALIKTGATALKAEIDAIRTHLDLVDPTELARRDHAARIDTEYRHVGMIVNDVDNLTQAELVELETALLTWKSLAVRSETPAEVDADLTKLVDLDSTNRFSLTGDEEADAMAAAVYPVPAAPLDPTIPWASH